MHNLSVCTMFKNESHSIKEWVEHYLYRGVDHLYLINDASEDGFLEIIQPYIDQGKITLFDAKMDYYLGRQRNLYTHFMLPRLKETKWLLVVDMDEYMWSPCSINMANFLLRDFSHLAQVQVRHSLYGSNGHIKHPTNIVESFTMRNDPSPCEGNIKYFINTEFEFSYLNIHHATFANVDDETHRFKMFGPEHFVLNHYCCQSLEHWVNIKCTRGDGDHYRVRTESDFYEVDKNVVEDMGLVEQNREILRIISDA